MSRSLKWFFLGVLGCFFWCAVALAQEDILAQGGISANSVPTMPRPMKEMERKREILQEEFHKNRQERKRLGLAGEKHREDVRIFREERRDARKDRHLGSRNLVPARSEISSPSQ